jgi:hypothetical protein
MENEKMKTEVSNITLDSKSKSKGMINYFIDCFLVITGIIMIYSGLLVQVRYHGRTMNPLIVSQIPDYIQWSQIHKISTIVIAVLACVHVYLHWKWYEVMFKKKLGGRHKITMIMTIIFLLSAITGFWAWIFRLLNDSPQGMIQEKHLIEIHDKLGIILAVLIIGHVMRRLRWLIRNGKTYLKFTRSTKKIRQSEMGL